MPRIMAEWTNYDHDCATPSFEGNNQACPAMDGGRKHGCMLPF